MRRRGFTAHSGRFRSSSQPAPRLVRRRSSSKHLQLIGKVMQAVPAYYLSQETLLKFLRETFGDEQDISAEIKQDYWVFFAPRELSKAEIETLHDLRGQAERKDIDIGDSENIVYSRAPSVQSSVSSTMVGSTNMSTVVGVDDDSIHDRFTVFLCNSVPVRGILQGKSSDTVKSTIETTTLQRKLVRLISDLSFDLQHEIQSRQYMLLAKYIKRNRFYLSTKICNSLAQFEARKLDLASVPNDMTALATEKRVEDFVNRVTTDRSILELVSDNPNDEDSTDENSEDDEITNADQFDQQSILSEFEHKLEETRSFQTFLDRFCAFLQPQFYTELLDIVNRCSRPNFQHYELCTVYDLSSIATELENVSPQDIRIGFASDRTVLNRFKGFIEHCSGHEWQWWPLAPYQEPLKSTESRLSWRCVCGMPRWVTAPIPFVERLDDIIKQAPVSSPLPAHPPSQQSQPQAASNPTPAAPGAQASPLAHPSQSLSSVLVQSVQSDPSAQPRAVASNQHQRLFAFLMSRAWQDYPVSEIKVRDLSQQPYIDMTCNDFFKQLRAEYIKKIPWFSYYFSVWRFNHCDFFKLQQYAAMKFSPDCADFPEPSNMNYEFRPRNLKTKRPIQKHEFYHRFYACSASLSLLHWLPFSHRCIWFNPQEKERLNLLPKRIFSLIFASDAPDEFWGLFAGEEPSFSYILFYHLLFLAPAIWFFFMWLFGWRHSGDLQDASVPLAMAMGGLSLFWAIFTASFVSKP